MTLGAEVLDLAVALDPAEARRYLGYPKERETPARGAVRLEALWPEAVALVRPRGAHAVVDRPSAEAMRMPEPAERVAVGAVTIGPALEDESARRAAAGALLDALVLDAIGSAAAEAAADALNLEVCAAARTLGLEAAPRVSPGYGGWDTSAQPALLALLPIAAIGIRLTSGAMMVPRKSVSFAASLAPPGSAHPHEGSRCARCGLLRCRHRIAPADCG